MKLFSKYNRINLLSTVVIFIIGSIAFSLLIHYIIINQIDENLDTERKEIDTHVKQYGNLPGIENVGAQYTSYQVIDSAHKPTLRFYTHRINNKAEHEKLTVRSVEWTVFASEKWYLVTVSESLDVTEDLIQSIIIITIALILLILIAGFLINRIVLQRLWQPFYHTMQRVQEFKLNDGKQLALDNSRIDEFNLMNTTLQQALNKAQHDYLALKEFTENASHELQTPLAIIGSKLDVMMQSEDLTEPQSRAISGTYDAITQLKKLNQSLLLLAKIENGQFAAGENIDLHQAITDKQNQLAEQWQSRHIVMHTSLEKAIIRGNAHLVDILLNNLFSNAVRHNLPGGFIRLHLQPQRLQISNSGQAKPLNEQFIFNRFYKGNSVSVQHGLGLSIVKQICDVSGYTCSYTFELPNVHSFTITW